jgi:TolA-binding protein
MSNSNVVGLNKVVDLHPEDLLERDAAGELDESERARLEAHLARCTTCRFERQLRGDFAEELEADCPPFAPFAPIALGVDFAAIARAPAAADASSTRLTEDAGRVPAAPLAPRRPYARRRTAKALWLLAAAALLLLAGGAAAAIGLGVRRWSVARIAETAAAPSEQAPAHPKLRRVITAAEPPLEATPPVEPSALPTAAVAPRVIAASATATAVPMGPGQLFDGEVEARRRGDYSRVLELHRELVQRFGTSREAQVSRATVGHLLLDRSDPAGALANFDAYLRAGSGDLAEEAMIGRATALERLGRQDEATLAWSALVAAFPGTAYAAHAQARIASVHGG